MASSDFQTWWQNQKIMAANREAYNPKSPMCPCSACWEGTGCSSFKKSSSSSSKAKSSEARPAAKTYKKFPGLSLSRRDSVDSMASDRLLLRTTTAATTATTATDFDQQSVQSGTDTLV